MADDRRAYVLERIRQRRRWPAETAPVDQILSNALSFGQQRLWFMEQLTPGTALFNEGFMLELSGNLDQHRLSAAFAAVVTRHEVLRTCFRAAGAGAEQVVAADVSFELSFVEASSIMPAVPEEADILDWATSFASRPFVLDEAPLLRAAVLSLDAARQILVVANHHLVSDAISRRTIAADLTAAYLGMPTNSALPPATPYRAFSLRQCRSAATLGWNRALRRWVEQLQDVPPIELPIDYARPAVEDPSGTRVEQVMPSDLARAVTDRARQLGTTPFSIHLAAFAFLLSRLTTGRDFAIGCPVDLREPAEADVVGFCANVLPIRTHVAEDLSTGEWIRQTHAQTLAALSDAQIPFEAMVEALRPPRNLSRPPVFQVGLSYEPRPAAPDFGGLRTSRVRTLDLGAARLELTLEIVPYDDGLHCAFEYRTSLFDRQTIATLMRRYAQVLASFVGPLDVPLADLDTILPGERELILQDWNATGQPYARDAGAWTRFQASVASAPDRLAVSAVDGQLDFASLARRVERWAAALAGTGVCAGSRVGVAIPRGCNLPAVILAIFGLGAVYVPLDTMLPIARLRTIVEDAGCTVIAVAPASREALSGVEAALVDAVDGDDAGRLPPPTLSAPAPGMLAYIIYTSGSTGVPKGVAVSHGSLAAFLAAMDLLLTETEGAWLAATSVAFDISLLELVWVPASGRTLVIAPESAALVTTGTVTAPPSAPKAVRAVAPEVSLFFFASEADAEPHDRYGLLIDCARFADDAGLAAIWTPERHFHPFGGLYPNPSVISAALARETRRIAIRAGSVVVPLHHPVRIAEDWSVVDNLSGGRVGVAFASGWQVQDFVFRPEAQAERYDVLVRAIEIVRALWAGEVLEFDNGSDRKTPVRLFPAPVQQSVPLWITASGSPATFETAGRLGTGVLTHLLGQRLDELADKIALYRRSRHAAGHHGDGTVTLMLHTHLGPVGSDAAARARGPLKRYLATSADLVRSLARATGHAEEVDRLDPADLNAILDQAVARYSAGASLIGSVEDAIALVRDAHTAGVDEIACLVDFGVPRPDILDGLHSIVALRDALQTRPAASGSHGVAPVAVLGDASVRAAQLTPTVVRSLLASPEGEEALSRLTLLVVGGEYLDAYLATRLAELPARCVNVYGPTEATIWATAEAVNGSGQPAIGRPLANMRAYVLDHRRRLLGIGIPGELWLGGEALATGYWNRPDATEAVFVPDPFATAPDALMYRTGDRAVWTADGKLRSLGRLDTQVKLRGTRLELGEIEAVARRLDSVADAVASLWSPDEGETRLVAYVVTAKGAPFDEVALRRHFGRHVPTALIPNHFVHIPAIPQTVSGKVDRGKLPAPLAGEGTLPQVRLPPASADLVQKIITLWRDEFKLDASTADRDFFDAGGHSLSAAQLALRCRELFGRPVPLTAFFADPTPAGLARLLEDAYDER